MKRILIVALVCALVLGASLAGAQTRENPNAQTSPYFYYALATDKAYTPSQNDTLPGATAGTGTKGLCSARLLSLWASANDTIAADIYVQRKNRSDTTWTTVHTDSLVYLGRNIGKEYSLRSGATEKFAGIEGALRVVFVTRAWNTAMVGTRKYSLRFNWVW